MNSIERGKATSTLHEWLTDVLTAPAQNVNIEGDAFAAVARNVPTRLKTYLQISSKPYEVTDTQQAVDNAGMAEMLGYHRARAGKELKRDVEKALLGNYISTAAASTGAASTRGATVGWMGGDRCASTLGRAGGAAILDRAAGTDSSSAREGRARRPRSAR